MDKRLDILKHLYGEAEDPSELGRLLDQDESLRREHQALSEVKIHLEQRPRMQPGSDAVEAVLAAAARQSAAAARQDRPPSSSRAMRRFRAAGLVSAALAVMAAVGVALWPDGSSPPDRTVAALQEQASAAMPAPPAAERPESFSGGDQVQSSLPADAERQEPAGRSVTANRELAADEAAASQRVVRSLAPEHVLSLEDENLSSAMLEWDEAEDLRHLHRQVEILEARSTGWSFNEPMFSPDANPALRTLDREY